MIDHLPEIQLLLTGNEIMSGDTIDSNSAVIAQQLGEAGMGIHRKVTLGDDAQLIADELVDMAKSADVVIVNGGLGPTIDDLTAEILAKAAGVALEERQEAVTHLQQWCARRNLRLNEANLKQAILPAGCTIIDNPIGSAVGFELSIGRCRIICTPGVPGELKAMLDHIVTSIAGQTASASRRNVLRLQTFGLGESTAQQIISDAIPDWPAAVELGFRAGSPQMEIKLSINTHSATGAQEKCRQQLSELFGDHIIGEGDTTLAQRVLQLLDGRNATLCTAESCTGGLIASSLTQVPGSSSGFHAGFVTYSNSIKHSVLGVSEDTLAQCGAVSEEVVREMARGALREAAADYVIAVSGIAGPGGGTPEKPVGTVWLAWGTAQDLRTCNLCWPVERTLFQTMIAAAGLDMIRRTLLGINTEPRYFDQRQARHTG